MLRTVISCGIRARQVTSDICGVARSIGSSSERLNIISDVSWQTVRGTYTLSTLVVHHVEAKLSTHIFRGVVTYYDGTRRRTWSTLLDVLRRAYIAAPRRSGHRTFSRPRHWPSFFGVNLRSIMAERSPVPGLGRDLSHDLGCPDHTLNDYISCVEYDTYMDCG